MCLCVLVPCSRYGPAGYYTGHGICTRSLWEERFMLMILAAILIVLWLLGVVGTYTIGAFVHFLLVAALVLFIVALVSGRRTSV
jgi:hypothetical protein